jgi:hypothetical protein
VTQSVLDKSVLEQQVQTYQANLPQVAEYLAGRGIPLEVARTCRLGYVSEPTPGLGDDQYVGKLAIPYLTPSGVVDIRFRNLSGSGPKYLSRPGGKSRLFGVNALFTSTSYVGICEGELDGVVATHVASVPSVSVPGASNWAKHYPLLFEGFQRVFVFADGDQAGKDFAAKVASTIEQAVVVTMPDGQDVSDVVVSEGPGALRKRAGISE